MALERIVEEVSARHVVFAGDDLGDLPAFDAVDRLRARGLTGLLVCSASDEQDVLVARSDLVLDGPDAVAVWLGGLADAMEARPDHVAAHAVDADSHGRQLDQPEHPARTARGAARRRHSQLGGDAARTCAAATVSAFPVAGAFTVGSVIISKHDHDWLEARPRLLQHEDRHCTQYAFLVGP